MQNINMEDRRRHHHRNHSSHRFSRLFPSSCRFDAFTDVVESSTVAQNLKNLHPIKTISVNTQKHKSKVRKYPPPNVKQSFSSNSCLFSTGEDEEGADSEIEIDNDCFSLSSDSSLSSSPEIRISRTDLGFSTRRINEVRICEVGTCSSSETSTSSSISSISPLKQPKPRLRVTLADKFSHDSETFRPKTWTKKHLHSHSPVSEEIRPKTEHLRAQSSVIFQKTEETNHLSSLSHSKNAEKHPKTEIHLCPIYMRGKIEESYALERESNDPYKDFRESMVEMILEKKISRAEDLEKLLLCFISLNSPVYHRVILDVFSEICEAIIGR